VLLALLIQTLLLHALSWFILWEVLAPCGLAVFIAWFAQKLYEQKLACLILWEVLAPCGKKANAAGARLVPINTTSPIATIAIKPICLIIISYLLFFYKTMVSSLTCGICHLI
jgi:hypothetical protein